MAQFEIKDGVAIIPEVVVTIGHGTFSRCEELQGVVIPEGVVDIDYGAFAMCNALRSIAFPASLRRIAHNAIALCKSLEEIIFNGRVEVEKGCYIFSRINEYGNLKVIRVPADDVEFYKSHLPESVRNLVLEG